MFSFTNLHSAERKINPKDLYVPQKSFEYRSTEKKLSHEVEHGMTSSHITFMADFIVGGRHGFKATDGHVSRKCIYNNQKPLIFSFDIPFILDVTIWECNKPVLHNESDVKIKFGDGI